MEYGTDKMEKVLIVTSTLSNNNSSEMVFDMVKSMRKEYNVDVLTKFPFIKDEINIIPVYSRFEGFLNTLKNKIKNKLSLNKVKISNQDPLYHFYELDEAYPPVPSRKILKKISSEYSFVIVFFWQGMLSSKSIADIYDKIKKPILLFAPDMFPMTGGCSYFWDCEGINRGCGKCPAIHSTKDEDITSRNFIFKKKVLSNVNMVFMGNTWQVNHAKKSQLFKGFSELYPIVNENVFRPRDRASLKIKHNCKGQKVLFFGAIGIHDPRKGFYYLLEALKILYVEKPELAESITLVIAGNGQSLDELKSYRTKYTGHLTYDELAEYYAMADVFLSPSIQDGGPMMLNQALMCGTPSVAFNIGTACDIINKGTGYLAKYKDSSDFAMGIIKMLSETSSNLETMYIKCRSQSLERSSYLAFRRNILRAYNGIINSNII